MGVISVPPGLRLSTSLLLLCVPLAALETIIASRAPWWRLPYDKMGLWSLAAALIAVPQAAWLARGKPWAFRLASAFALAWTALTLWYAFRTKNAALGFFALGLAILLGGMLSWIRHELRRSYFDPSMEWYQGLPSRIPGVDCELVHGNHAERFSVSRLDRDGAFIFQRGQRVQAADPSSASEWWRSHVSLRFQFRGREVSCTAQPIRMLERNEGVGAGFRFRIPSSDTRKEIGDFVELLRGEGYVS